ncbi:MAG: OsmC family protein [Elusimicrobia bacterium]|nr:OsmC family protein [Elusimicrobiota bacterium]
MEIRIRFPGNKKVSADFKDMTVLTDQPKDSGGDGSAPSPFELFLASIGACAGIFALSFCQKRNIPTDGLEIIQTVSWDEEEHRVGEIAFDITLPKDFPEKYRETLVHTVNGCTVKKHILAPPRFKVRVRPR